MQDLDIRLMVARRETLAEDVVGFYFVAIGEPAELPVWTPGAHIELVLSDGAVRQYSLCGDPSDCYRYRIAVLREAKGRGGSRQLHDLVQVGAEITARGPRNNFHLVTAPRYLFIAGGIGITPILPMIASAENARADWLCVYGGRNLARMAFIAELERFGDRVQIKPQDRTGLLELDALLGCPGDTTLVYCCGPEGLLRAVEDRCTRARWPSGSLRLERFGPASVTVGEVNQPLVVELARRGVSLEVPATRSILEALEDIGIFIPSSCGVGTCGTCEVTVVDGVPLHRDSILSAEERARGDHMMVCVSRASSARLVLDL